MPTASLTSRLRLALSLLGDAVRMLRRVPTMRERARLMGLAGRAFLRIASRQPGIVGRLFPSPKLRSYELRPEAGVPALRLRSDDLVCVEVYGGRPYELDYSPIEPVSTILDLGANVGAAAAFLSLRFPEAALLAVEPNPATYEVLCENLRRAVPRGRALRAAVVPRDGSYRIEPGRTPSGGQVVATDGGGDDPAAEFETLTIGELLDREMPGGVDLMKVDIEGGEADLFAAAADWGRGSGRWSPRYTRRSVPSAPTSFWRPATSSRCRCPRAAPGSRSSSRSAARRPARAAPASSLAWFARRRA